MKQSIENKNPSVNTQKNTKLLNDIQQNDKIIIAGEALSHCVKETCNSIMNDFGDKKLIEKITLLEDGSSPVTSPVVDFPAIAKQFVEEAKNRGMKTALTTDFY